MADYNWRFSRGQNDQAYYNSLPYYDSVPNQSFGFVNGLSNQPMSLNQNQPMRPDLNQPIISDNPRYGQAYADTQSAGYFHHGPPSPVHIPPTSGQWYMTQDQSTTSAYTHVPEQFHTMNATGNLAAGHVWPSDLDMNQDLPPKQPQKKSKSTKALPDDWKKYKKILQRIYCVQDWSVKETRDYMRDTHRFEASEKEFRDQFDEWGWIKYVKHSWKPIFAAMAVKRKVEENKDTVYELKGGKIVPWRVTVPAHGLGLPYGLPDADVDLPKGVKCHTPSGSESSGDGSESMNLIDSPARGKLRSNRSHVGKASAREREQGFIHRSSRIDRRQRQGRRSSITPRASSATTPKSERDSFRNAPSLDTTVERSSTASSWADRNYDDISPHVSQLTAILRKLDQHPTSSPALRDEMHASVTERLTQMLESEVEPQNLTSFVIMFAIVSRIIVLGKVKKTAELLSNLIDAGWKLLHECPDKLALASVCAGKVVETHGGWHLAEQFFGRALSSLCESGEHSRCCLSIQYLEDVMEHRSSQLPEGSPSTRTKSCPMPNAIRTLLDNQPTSHSVDEFLKDIEDN